VHKSIHVFQTYYTLRHTACPIMAIANSALVSSPVVSHANKSRTPSRRLFRNAVVGVEAVGELLAVLVGGVVRQHLLARRALERLEAGFALDGLGRGVLVAGR
jgi:hypothetical protein